MRNEQWERGSKKLVILRNNFWSDIEIIIIPKGVIDLKIK